MISYKTLIFCGSVLFITKDAKSTRNISLQASFVYVFEGESVNLTCALNKSAEYKIIWTNPIIGRIDYSNQTNECSGFGPLFQSGEYSVYCNETAVAVTVPFLENTISQQWTCQNVSCPYVASSYVLFGVRTVNVNLTTKDSVNPGTVSLRENSTLDLQCTSSYARPNADIKLYGYNDSNIHVVFNTQFMITTYENNTAGLNKTISKISFKTARYMDKWTLYCKANNSINRDVKSNEVLLDILYPPENVTVSSLFQLNKPQQKIISVIENIEINIYCSATANPAPGNISWSGIYTSVSRELRILSNRNITGNLTCFVSNTMTELPKNKTTYGNISKTYVLDVLYPPSIQSLSNISIIENNSLSVVCKIIQGNPSQPVYIRWINTSFSTFGNESVLEINKVNKRDGGWRTCEVIYTLVPTFGDTYTGKDSRQFYLDVLYPPENIKINSTTEPNHNASGRIRMIENTFLTLFCSAEGNPKPLYSWSGINASNTSTVSTYSSKNSKKNITCSVSNMMKETSNYNTINGQASKTLFVDSLYSPVIFNQTSTTAVEGEDFNISCFVTPGQVSTQSTLWFGRQIESTKNNPLMIRNVTKQHAGKLTCNASYTMIPTYGETQYDVITKDIFLDVLYKASVSNFSVDNDEQNASVTVNENSDVRMVCIVDSNPYSTVNISIRNKTVALKNHTQIVEHHIRKSNCSDTGIYECSGHNFLNLHMPSLSKKLRLFVNCLPRPSSPADVRQNITTSQYSSVTFTFVVMAYPPPHFDWFRVEDEQLTIAVNGYSKMQNISEYELQINFVLTRVHEYDFGEYLLKVNNTFGEFRQSFFLLKTEQSTPDDSIAGPVAGGVIGSILGIVVIVAAVFLIRKREILKKSIDGENKHEYQNVDLPGGGDCTETADCGISNVYEQLHNAGSDQQYQQLRTFAVADNEGQRIVYENLRI